jgi:hypothetical protein
MPAPHLLEIAGFEFRFAARSPMRLGGYLGSAWRGGEGGREAEPGPCNKLSAPIVRL